MKTKQELKAEIERLQAEYDAMSDDCDFEPNRGDTFYFVGSDGYLDETSLETLHKEFHNVFPTLGMAEKAAKLMRRSNAIIRACLLVDPDFDPDWNDVNQEKFGFFYNYGRSSWMYDQFSYDIDDSCTCHVSTEEKALKVIKLLEKWGVE